MSLKWSCLPHSNTSVDVGRNYDTEVDGKDMFRVLFVLSAPSTTDTQPSLLFLRNLKKRSCMG